MLECEILKCSNDLNKRIRRAATAEACVCFSQKVITNGDKIRQMSNVELADLLDCNCCSEQKNDWCNHISCKQGKLAWLNAPADCVKQTAENDTQTDLCKADDTQKEVAE